MTERKLAVVVFMLEAWEPYVANVSLAVEKICAPFVLSVACSITTPRSGLNAELQLHAAVWVCGRQAV